MKHNFLGIAEAFFTNLKNKRGKNVMAMQMLAAVFIYFI
jgi:hypothetical protein